MRPLVYAVIAVLIIGLTWPSANLARSAGPASYSHHCFGAQHHTPYELEYTIQGDSPENAFPGRTITGAFVGLFMDGIIFTFTARTGKGKTFSPPNATGSKTVASLQTNSFGRSGTAHFSRWHKPGIQDVARLIVRDDTIDFVCDVA